jgi:hypothetical protein
MRSRLAANEDEDAEGDAQLQEEIVERERRKAAYGTHGKRRKKTTRRISKRRIDLDGIGVVVCDFHLSPFCVFRVFRRPTPLTAS